MDAKGGSVYTAITPVFTIFVKAQIGILPTTVSLGFLEYDRY